MQNKYWDIVAIITTASVAVAVMVMPLGIGGAPPWTLLGVLLVLVLPGYAITAAALPIRRLEFPATLALSFGGSIAVAVLGGLLLNLTPWGLGTTSWSVFLGGVTLGAGGIALIRRTDARPAAITPAVTLLRRRDKLYLGVAALVTVAAAVNAYNGAASQEFPGFTQLWMLPEASSGQPATLRVAVSNREHAPTEYRLELQIGGKIIRDWAAIGLQSNEQWETTVTLPPDDHSSPELVEALLYRLDAPDSLYRRVAVWQ